MSDTANLSPDGQQASLPMFYATPRALDISKDSSLRISRPKHFNFAANTNAIPLLVDEFPMASAYYPIVFADGPAPVPAAIVGLRNDKNLFVDTDGQWHEGAYLPAYVRRYPFILMDDPAHKQYVLCIDEASDMFGQDGEFALFEDGKPSSFTQGAMEFCAALRQQGDATNEFIKALQDYKLLKPQDTEVDLPDGTRLQLKGFQVIDPKKFDELPDNVYLSWRRKGWIGLVYAHLLSSHRWQYLSNLAHK
jgi:hypothetical protein